MPVESGTKHFFYSINILFMKTIVWYNSWLVPKGFIGITLWPVINIALSKDDYIKKYGEERLNNSINHESIHIKQQAEMLVIFFYIWYLIEWFIKLFKYEKGAYMNLSFEREAYGNARYKDYLNIRKKYSWIKYL